MELQQSITAERYEQRIGRTVRAFVDRVHPDGSVEARTVWQADDVDGITMVAGDELRAGMLIDVAIEDVVDDYNFAASLVRVVSAPPAPGRVARQLPVVGSGSGASVGSYGR